MTISHDYKAELLIVHLKKITPALAFVSIDQNRGKVF